MLMTLIMNTNCKEEEGLGSVKEQFMVCYNFGTIMKETTSSVGSKVGSKYKSTSWLECKINKSTHKKNFIKNYI